MSSGRQIGSFVGQVAGFFIGGPIGATIGGIIGGEVGGAIDGPPSGPRLDDTSAPTLEFGAKVPRLYGRVWCTLSPRWWSGLRESSEVVGGKGGDSGQEQYSYHADLLGVLGEVDLTRWPNPVWTRIRLDGEIVASRLAASSTATLTASASTEQWNDVELFNGAAAQAPWSVMEAVVGAANAIAYRGVVTVGFTNLLMPNGRRPSLIEVEVATAATAVAPIADLTRLQCAFPGDAIDISCLANGAATITGTRGSLGGGLNVDTTAAVTGGYKAAWSSTSYAGNSTSPVTIEAWCDLTTSPNVSYLAWLRYDSSGGIRRFGWENNRIIYDTNAFGIQYIGPGGGGIGRHHYAVVLTATDERFYVDGALVYSTGVSSIPAGGGASLFEIGTTAGSTGPLVYNVEEFRIRYEEVYTADFTPPATIPDPEPCNVGSFTPAQVALQDVLESEMLRCRPLTAGKIDMSAAAGKLVWGFKPADSAAAACATLLDWYYLDLFCSDKITAVARGGAVEQTIPFGYSGAGSDGASDPFAGLVRENDVELQRSTSVGYISILADAESDSVNGARVGTGNAIRQISFPIYSIASEAKGRADTITHDTRVAAHKATVRLSARHAAKLQPASIVTLVDNKGISYRVRVLRLVWNRGVYDVDVCLDDPNILTNVGIATDVDTAVIEVPTPGIAEFIALDLPKLVPADEAPGYLGLVKTPDAAGARWFDSADDVTYAARADYLNDATFGTVTAASGSFNRAALFDEGSSLTVNLGEGTIPASATRAALLADRGLNAFAVGINGRLVLGQFRTVTTVSPGVCTLTGFVNMGAKGTEQYCGSIVAGDRFALLGNQGTARIPRTLAQLGGVTYTKAVAVGRNLTGVTAVQVTPQGVSLKPLSPVSARAARNAATGDIVVSWTRRTRDDTRFGGPLGDACPLGETTEQYRARLYTDATYTTLLRDLGVVTTATVPYTAAQRTADGRALTDPLYVDARQISDVLGEGYPLQATA